MDQDERFPSLVTRDFSQYLLNLKQERRKETENSIQQKFKMHSNIQGRLSPTHRPDIVRGRGRPRPATIGLPVDKVHSPLLDTAPQSTKPNLLTPADFLRRYNYGFVSPGPASLPKCWEHEAGLYFSALENIFRAKGVTDKIKSDSLLYWLL